MKFRIEKLSKARTTNLDSYPPAKLGSEKIQNGIHSNTCSRNESLTPSNTAPIYSNSNHSTELLRKIVYIPNVANSNGYHGYPTKMAPDPSLGANGDEIYPINGQNLNSDIVAVEMNFVPNTQIMDFLISVCSRYSLTPFSEYGVWAPTGIKGALEPCKASARIGTLVCIEEELNLNGTTAQPVPYLKVLNRKLVAQGSLTTGIQVDLKSSLFHTNQSSMAGVNGHGKGVSSLTNRQSLQRLGLAGSTYSSSINCNNTSNGKSYIDSECNDGNQRSLTYNRTSTEFYEARLASDANLDYNSPGNTFYSPKVNSTPNTLFSSHQRDSTSNTNHHSSKSLAIVPKQNIPFEMTQRILVTVLPLSCGRKHVIRASTTEPLGSILARLFRQESSLAANGYEIANCCFVIPKPGLTESQILTKSTKPLYENFTELESELTLGDYEFPTTSYHIYLLASVATTLTNFSKSDVFSSMRNNCQTLPAQNPEMPSSKCGSNGSHFDRFNTMPNTSSDQINKIVHVNGSSSKRMDGVSYKEPGTVNVSSMCYEKVQCDTMKFDNASQISGSNSSGSIRTAPSIASSSSSSRGSSRQQPNLRGSLPRTLEDDDSKSSQDYEQGSLIGRKRDDCESLRGSINNKNNIDPGKIITNVVGDHATQVKPRRKAPLPPIPVISGEHPETIQHLAVRNLKESAEDSKSHASSGYHGSSDSPSPCNGQGIIARSGNTSEPQSRTKKAAPKPPCASPQLDDASINGPVTPVDSQCNEKLPINQSLYEIEEHESVYDVITDYRNLIKDAGSPTTKNDQYDNEISIQGESGPSSESVYENLEDSNVMSDEMRMRSCDHSKSTFFNPMNYLAKVNATSSPISSSSLNYQHDRAVLSTEPSLNDISTTADSHVIYTQIKGKTSSRHSPDHDGISSPTFSMNSYASSSHRANSTASGQQRLSTSIKSASIPPLEKDTKQRSNKNYKNFNNSIKSAHEIDGDKVISLNASTHPRSQELPPHTKPATPKTTHFKFRTSDASQVVKNSRVSHDQSNNSITDCRDNKATISSSHINGQRGRLVNYDSKPALLDKNRERPWTMNTLFKSTNSPNLVPKPVTKTNEITTCENTNDSKVTKAPPAIKTDAVTATYVDNAALIKSSPLIRNKEYDDISNNSNKQPVYRSEDPTVNTVPSEISHENVKNLNLSTSETKISSDKFPTADNQRCEAQRGNISMDERPIVEHGYTSTVLISSSPPPAPPPLPPSALHLRPQDANTSKVQDCSTKSSPNTSQTRSLSSAKLPAATIRNKSNSIAATFFQSPSFQNSLYNRFSSIQPSTNCSSTSSSSEQEHHGPASSAESGWSSADENNNNNASRNGKMSNQEELVKKNKMVIEQIESSPQLSHTQACLADESTECLTGNVKAAESNFSDDSTCAKTPLDKSSIISTKVNLVEQPCGLNDRDLLMIQIRKCGGKNMLKRTSTIKRETCTIFQS